MARRIVPKGFESTAHKVFFEFVKPPSELQLGNIVDLIDTSETTFSEDSPCNQCPICLSDYNTPVTLVSCTHSYCMECLLLWYAKKIQCPLCKTSGRLFVRSDDLSSDRGVRVFAVDTFEITNSQIDIKRAIDIHRLRFLPEVLEIEASPSDSLLTNELYDRKSQKQVFETITDAYTTRKESRKRERIEMSKFSTLDDSTISLELKRISKGLDKATSRLKKIDEKIRNFE